MNYPYQTVDGISCAGYEVMPGCTFNIDRTRVTVSHDPFYNRFGGGSNDLWSIKFDSFGTSYVYDDFGTFQYTAAISSYSGWVSGNTIGVGTSGLYWENVAGGTYWLGKNSVLYSGNTLSAKYGQAIN
jgi:hypothetical protein